MSESDWNPCSTFHVAMNLVLCFEWTVIFIISAAIIVPFFKQLRNPNHSIASKIQYLTAMSYFSMFIGVVVNLSYVSQWSLYCFDIFSFKSFISLTTLHMIASLEGSISSFAYIIGLVSIALLFAVRLRLTLNGTPFAFTSGIYNIFITLCGIDFILATLGIFVILIHYLNHHSFSSIGSAIAAFSLILYLITSFFLLLLFVRSLLRLSNYFTRATMTLSGRASHTNSNGVPSMNNSNYSLPRLSSHAFTSTRTATSASSHNGHNSDRENYNDHESSQSEKVTTDGNCRYNNSINNSNKTDNHNNSSNCNINNCNCNCKSDTNMTCISTNIINPGEIIIIGDEMEKNEKNEQSEQSDHEKDKVRKNQFENRVGEQIGSISIVVEKRIDKKKQTVHVIDEIKIESDGSGNQQIKKEFINIMTKFSVLVFFQLCSTFIATILLIFLASLYEITQIPFHMFWIYMPMEYLANIICLVLQLQFNQKYFDQLCFQCSKQLQNKFLKLIDNATPPLTLHISSYASEHEST